MYTIQFPLISCLCVTRNKPEQLKRAVHCFLNQTYPNKELIIVFEEDDPETKAVAVSVAGDRIKYFEIPVVPKMSLGSLRNFSIDQSAGEYFAQWDDDDWYHVSRLEMQYDAILKSHKPASYLAFWLIYDSVNNCSYLSLGPWAGSILCKKNLIGEGLRYPDLARHEDFEFMKELVRGKYLVPVVMPSLYIYAYHGGNTFGEDHFRELFSHSQQLPAHVTELIGNIFSQKISSADAAALMLSPDTMGTFDYFYYEAGSVPAQEAG